MRKISLFFGLIVSVLILSGCTSNEKALENVGLAGLSGKEILIGVANQTILVENYDLSVYDDQLVVIVGNKRIPIEMPQDEFYLAVAPYKTLTHECLIHSATGCVGELKNERFFVEFVDFDGNIIISKMMDSMENGFIDLWLPRDLEGTLTITQGMLSVSKTISTNTGEPTCETTMKLS